jgi:hypothetical protein
MGFLFCATCAVHSVDDAANIGQSGVGEYRGIPYGGLEKPDNERTGSTTETILGRRRGGAFDDGFGNTNGETAGPIAVSP